MTKLARIPNQFDLSAPILQAIDALGGSARIGEIVSTVIKRENFSDEIVNPLHKGSTIKTELEYRMDWARTTLKKQGYLENSTHGVWTLTAKAKKGIKEERLPTSREFLAEHQKSLQKNDDSKPLLQSTATDRVDSNNVESNDNENTIVESVDNEMNDGEEWQVQLSNVLHNIEPFAFERLCRRLLLEVGFLNVENTQSTRDGGFDGSGQMKINGLVSTNVIFECKRYAGQVGPDVVRRLRGTMQGKADYGFLIVTSGFSQAAKTEAAHSAGGCIELIDGNRLAALLKEFNVGVDTEVVEKVVVNSEYFKNL